MARQRKSTFYQVEIPSGAVIATDARIHQYVRRDARKRRLYFCLLVERRYEETFVAWLRAGETEPPSVDAIRVLAWGYGARPPRTVRTFLRERFNCELVDHGQSVKPFDQINAAHAILEPARPGKSELDDFDARFEEHDRRVLAEIEANDLQRDKIAWKSRYDSHWRGIILPSAQRPDMTDAQVRQRVVGGKAGEFYIDSHQELTLLKSYLVYWDRLIVPFPDVSKLTAMGFREAPAREKLRKWGVLEPRQVDPTGLDVDGEQLLAFSELEKEESGRWVVAIDRMKEEAILRNPGRSLIAKLHNVLPVPSVQTSFEEILEFHEKRRAEGVALRERIDELYQGIVSAGDGPLQLQQTLTAIGSAIADQSTVMEEAGLRFQFAGLEARMKWEFDLAKVSGSSLAAALAAGSVLIGAAAGVASNLIPKVEISTAAGALRNSAKGPWGYALRVQKEL